MKEIQIPKGLHYNFFLTTGDQFTFRIFDECKFIIGKTIPVKISKKQIRIRDSFPLIHINHMLFALIIKAYLIHTFISSGNIFSRIQNFFLFLFKTSEYDLFEQKSFFQYSPPQRVQILHDFYLFRFGGISLRKEYYPMLKAKNSYTIEEIYERFTKLNNEFLESKIGVENVKSL